MEEKISGPLEALEIAKILPHRYPFLLVDRVLELRHDPMQKNRVGSKSITLKNFTYNEAFFAGHFPHRPVVPGVILIECMAQSGALAAWRKEDAPQDVAICGIRDAKFRKPVIPGDALEMRCEVVKQKNQMLVVACVGFVNKEKVVEAELIAIMTDLVPA